MTMLLWGNDETENFLNQSPVYRSASAEDRLEYISSTEDAVITLAEDDGHVMFEYEDGIAVLNEDIRCRIAAVRGLHI